MVEWVNEWVGMHAGESRYISKCMWQVPYTQNYHRRHWYLPNSTLNTSALTLNRTNKWEYGLLRAELVFLLGYYSCENLRITHISISINWIIQRYVVYYKTFLLQSIESNTSVPKITKEIVTYAYTVNPSTISTDNYSHYHADISISGKQNECL